MAKKHPIIGDMDDRLDDIRKQNGQVEDSGEDEDLEAEDSDDLDEEESDDEEEDDDEDTEEETPAKKTPKKEKKAAVDEDSDEDDDDEEDSDEDDDSDEDEDDDEDKDSEPRKKRPGEVITELKREKRDAETLSKALLELIGASSVEDAKTKLDAIRASQKPSQEFADAAKGMGIADPENVQKLFELFKTNIEKDVVEGKVKPLETQLGDIMDAVAPILSANAVQKEWDEFVPTLEKSFPQASRSQLKEANKLMRDLVETEKYTKSGMDFVLFKEFDQFEDIFGPAKRRTMLPARQRPAAPTEKTSKSGLPEIDRTSHESILKARKQMKRIAAGDDLREDTDNEI